MMEQLKDIHAWFTGERELPEKGRTLTEQAAALFLGAREPNYVYGWYDGVSYDAWKLLGTAIAEGDLEALRLATYLDMGLWIRAKQDLSRLPITLLALYGKTGDEEIKQMLADYPTCRNQLKRERDRLRIIAGTNQLMEQGLPTDLGAHDPAYYGDE